MKQFIKKRYVYISIFSFLILLIILLGFYPGIVCYDGDNQWQQVKSGFITNSHPFFSTFFMLLLSKIWNKVTIVIIYQILIVSISWGYLCKVIDIKNKKQMIVMILFSIFVMLSPLICLYSITLWKDTLYTSYLFLCSIMLYEWADNNYSFSKFKYFLLGLLMAMVFSYRHNGIIVAILMILIFYLLCIKKFRKKIISKSALKNALVVLVSFILTISVIAIPKRLFLDSSRHLANHKTDKEVTHSTIDGYILWMMGAHLKDNNIKDSEDKKFLNKIIPLDEWKEAYNPYLINDTNFANNLDDEYLIKNSSKLRNIFIKYSLKYPMTIISHYLKADSLLLNPFASFQGYVYVYAYPVMWYLPKYTTIKPKIPYVEKIYSKLMNYSFNKPFIMFYQPAFILYLSLFLTVFLSKRYFGKKIWCFSLPMILNTVSLLPINLAQDLRYVYINYFVFFGLVLMFIINSKEILRKKGKIITKK